MVAYEFIRFDAPARAFRSLAVAKSLQRFRRNNIMSKLNTNTNTLLSSPGINHTLVFSAPRHKLDNGASCYSIVKWLLLFLTTLSCASVLDKKRELQTELPPIADTSNLDAKKPEGVVKALVQHYDSCHFAYINVTKYESDEEMKFEHDNDAADFLFSHDCLQFAVYNRLKCCVNKLVEIIHGGLKTIKKINYNGKCSKQIFREVLNRELVKHDVAEENSMVDNDYFVVTILVLASGIYSIPSSMCNTEHVKTALPEFNTIPKSRIEETQKEFEAQKLKD